VKSINRKLNGLENNVLQDPIIGSTKFCTCGFPEPEQVLLERARQLAVMEIPYDETTEAQRAILEKAVGVFNFRVFDLFTTYLEGLLCRGDKIAIMTLHERFLWFITELRKEIHQQLEVTEIEKNTPEDCEVDRVDEYFRKAPELWTPESYDKISTGLFLDLLKNSKKLQKYMKQLDKKVKQHG
jgi:hypothetical protein